MSISVVNSMSECLNPSSLLAMCCFCGGHRKALETFPEFSDFEALGVPLAANEKALATLSQAGMSVRRLVTTHLGMVKIPSIYGDDWGMV